MTDDWTPHDAEPMEYLALRFQNDLASIRREAITPIRTPVPAKESFANWQKRCAILIEDKRLREESSGQ